MFFPIHFTLTDKCAICTSLLPKIKEVPGYTVFIEECHENFNYVAKTLFKECAKRKGEGQYKRSFHRLTFEQLKIILDVLASYGICSYEKKIRSRRVTTPSSNVICSQMYPYQYKVYSVRFFWSIHTDWFRQNKPLARLTTIPLRPTHESNSLKKLSKLWQSALQQKECDITINCVGGSLYGHRCVLSASSKHFRTILAADCVETASNEIDLIFPKKAVQAYLEYLYTGTIENLDILEAYTIQDLFDILEVSELHQKKKLSLLCLNHLDKALTEENFVEIMTGFKAYQQQSLKIFLLEAVERNDKLLPAFKKGLYGISKADFDEIEGLATSKGLSSVEKELKNFAVYAF
jgi:hypothetical protein